ncbi:ABC transporter ATP-binding protein [Corticibacter populi]|uniref:ABC transporter ATP-binding protein n=1 Tax=Corticibacter populi TaxID=1550736 RepID=A0A3M6QZ72_9BURK|nr:ABC transporter ATP-binding protein [Corticibacter populi]RMX08255.1 ABC transporter ATP-binding protein [Corticibacter populi]RZS35530.1 iron complex transport system ATP-binding protein [Corticibacter populi]
MTHSPPILQACGLRVQLGHQPVLDGLDLVLPEGRITAVIGPNGCGKSTLLRSLARLLKPQTGQVLLDGQDIHRLSTREVARRLGLLPQSAQAPAGIRVAELVARGRFAHQGLLRQWSEADARAVEQAMHATCVAELAERAVDTLSGGQRQRVWLALALAQQTSVLLLDEPTTYLDLAHQIEILELCRTLNRDDGRTLVLVLHDLNQAARYADHLVAMKDGAIAASGHPDAVLTPEVLARVFGVNARILRDPLHGTPLILIDGLGRVIHHQGVARADKIRPI